MLLTSSIILSMLLVINADDQCPSLKSPDDFHIQQVIGKWYAVRGIEHNPVEVDSGATRRSSCPIITLSLKKDDQIEFKWQTDGKPVKKVKLSVNDTRDGLFLYKGSKGSPFNSFQVTKLDNDPNFWAGTMCKPGGRSASVILSKTPKFDADKVSDLTSKLSSQGLSTTQTFDRCI